MSGQPTNTQQESASQSVVRLPKLKAPTQIGGKGGIRRKKFRRPPPKKNPDVQKLELGLHEVKTLLNEVTSDDYNQFVTYHDLFKKEFLSAIHKKWRKSNKTHTHLLIKEHLDSMLFRGDHKDTIAYIQTHVVSDSHKMIIQFFKNTADIIKTREYMDHDLTKVEHIDDETLKASFESIGLTQGDKLAPTWVRAMYQFKLKSTTDDALKSKIQQDYQNILYTFKMIDA